MQLILIISLYNSSCYTVPRYSYPVRIVIGFVDLLFDARENSTVDSTRNADMNVSKIRFLRVLLAALATVSLAACGGAGGSGSSGSTTGGGSSTGSGGSAQLASCTTTNYNDAVDQGVAP
ncbi:MAG: hypothetical protein ACP5P4_14980, partial [Steroidobacteraceae bacterium]